MGIDDRDYMRRGPPRAWPLGKLLLIAAIATVALIIVELAQKRSNNSDHEIPKGSLRVNINTASEEQLESLPSIGPSRAKSIIDHRPYATVDDLATRQALGKKILETIRLFLKTDGASEELHHP
jgi:competence protein ComEA